MLRRIAFTLLVLLMVAPLLMVVLAPLYAEAPEWEYVRTVILPSHLHETARLLILAAGLAMLLGTVSAWLIASSRFPGHGFFRWALMLPLAIPTYIGAITFASLLGPTGSLTIPFRALTGIGIDILTPDGLALCFGLLLYPYVYLPARAAFGSGMGDMLAAARMLGASPWRRAWRVAIPLARPAIVGGGLLVAMETLNDYGAVQHYGVHTLTAGIFRTWGGLYDTGSALRLSGILLFLVLLIALAEQHLDRKARRTATGQPLAAPRLRGWKAWGAATWCSLLVGFAFVLPVTDLLIDAYRQWGRSAWQDLGAPIWNTLRIALASTVLTLTVAVLLAYAQRSGSIRAARYAALGYAVPGAVIAIGVMGLAGRLADASGWILIGSLSLVIYAFSVRFLAMAANPVNAGMAQQARALDEAAKLLGASPARTFLRINLPLLRPALLAAAAITLIEVIKELPLTLILRPFDMDTLSTRVYYMARIEEWPMAAPPALLIVACGSIPVLLLERWMERR